MNWAVEKLSYIKLAIEELDSKELSNRGVSYPGKGECADPVNKDAILGRVGGGRPGQNRKRQFNSDTGDGKT
jgi:hypothetical protein